MTTTMYLAGAGSGKTYTVANEISSRVGAGEARPEGVIATTFTEKAAEELRSRCRAVIAESGTPEMVAGFERSMVGTVHGLGMRFISRFYSLAGVSPRLTAMDRNQSQSLLYTCIARLDQKLVERCEELSENLEQDSLGAQLSELDNLCRSNGIAPMQAAEQMVESASIFLDKFCEAPSNNNLSHALSEVQALLHSYDAAKQEGRFLVSDQSVYVKLRAALGRPHNYRRWVSLVGARPTVKSGIKFDNLRQIVGDISSWKTFHQDIIENAVCIGQCYVALSEDYERAKETMGVVDFTDLEVKFLQLLDVKEVQDAIRQEFDLLVVDEFQDTNPIQLAIFLKLGELIPEVIWVGDPKQSIYGFRGTDPELVGEVQKFLEVEPKRLKVSYRSDRSIVEFNNDFVKQIWTDDDCLDARPDAAEGDVSVIYTPELRNVDFESLVDHVRVLSQKAGSIGVLANSNADVSKILSLLRQGGIDASGVGFGLFKTWEAKVLFDALRLRVDPQDSLALVRLERLLHGTSSQDWLVAIPALLSASREEFDTLGLLESIDDIITNLDLVRLAYRRRFGAAREQNIIALRKSAQQYIENQSMFGWASSIPGFLAWSEMQASFNLDFFPDSGAKVTVLTVHKAKGLGWNHVVYTCKHSPKKSLCIGLKVTGGGIVNGDPLAMRKLRYWPWPFGSSSHGPVQYDSMTTRILASDEEIEAIRLERRERERVAYVAITRAKNSLTLMQGPSTIFNGLGSEAKPLNWINEKGHRLAVSGVTIRDAGLAPRDELGPVMAPPAIPEKPTATPGILRPSEAVQTVEATTRVVQLAPPITTSISKRGLEAKLGDAIHACFAAIQFRGEVSPEEIKAILKSYQVGDLVEAKSVLLAYASFAEFAGPDWQSEVSIQSRIEGGEIVSGSIDALVRREGGLWVIDHKTTACEPAFAETLALEHVPQMLAYKQALEGLGEEKIRSFIHFPLVGVVVELIF